MPFTNPATEWYSWCLAILSITFWLVWILLLGRYIADQPLSLKVIQRGYLAFGIAMLVSVSTLSVLQYQAFRAGPLGRLPQREFIQYWFNYSEIHYVRAWVVGIVVALVFAFLFWLLKKLSRGRLINQEELELSLLFGFFNPWPATAIFFILAFLLFVLASLGLTLMYRFFPSFFIPQSSQGADAFGERHSGDAPVNSRSEQAKIRNWNDPPAGGEWNSVNSRSAQGEFTNVGAQAAISMQQLQIESPRLTITPFLFIAAFFAPIITRPILLDWLHLGVIFITTS